MRKGRGGEERRKRRFWQHSAINSIWFSALPPLLPSDTLFIARSPSLPVFRATNSTSILRKQKSCLEYYSFLQTPIFWDFLLYLKNCKNHQKNQKKKSVNVFNKWIYIQSSTCFLALSSHTPSHLYNFFLNLFFHIYNLLIFFHAIAFL